MKIEELTHQRFAMAEGRADLAQRMLVRSQRLESLAEYHRLVVFNKIVSHLIIDAMATGISLYLSRTVPAEVIEDRMKELLNRSGQAKAAAKAADAVGDGPPEAMYEMLVRSGAKETKDPAQRLEATWLGRNRLVAEYVEEARSTAAREGADVAAAAKRAQLEAETVVKNVELQLPLRQHQKRLEELYDLYRGVAKECDPGWSPDAAQALAATGYARVFDMELARKLAAELQLQPPRDLIRTFDTDAEVAQLWLGEMIGITASDLTWAAIKAKLEHPRLDTLASMTSGRASLLKGIKGNLVSNLVTLAAAAGKHYVTAEANREANEAAVKWWQIYCEVGAYFTCYQALLMEEKPLYDNIRELKKDMIVLQCGLDALDGRREAKAETPGYVWDPACPVVIVLDFSNYLSTPPIAKIGGVEVLMKPLQEVKTDLGIVASPAFRGEIPAEQLPEGKHDLTVSLTEDCRPWNALDAEPETPTYLISPVLDKWLEYQKGAATYKGAIEVDFTLHRAIVKLEALLKRFAEEGAVTNMDYGSGAGGTGWSGMSKSLREAHRRVGAARIEGDSHGQTWMRANGLGIDGSAGEGYVKPLKLMQHLLWQKQLAMKKLDDLDRAYLAYVDESMAKWETDIKSFHPLMQKWLDACAMFTVIGAIEDPQERARRHDQNEQDRDGIEKQVRALFAGIEPFDGQ